ncbi:MAG: carboxypeptidase regulatory-like domain-containing protein [Silvibacterium sp.]
MCNRFEDGGTWQKPSRLRMLVYSLLAVLLTIPLGLHAQQYSGTIVGTVTDSTGAAIPGAIVTVINTGTGSRITQTSGGHGEFTFAQLPIGTYEVHVKQGNFKEFIETGVIVHTSTNTEVPSVLQVGSVTQRITVAADSIQVQTTSAAVGEIVTSTQVHELPLNGENFMGLTTLSPGVSPPQGFNATGKGLQGSPGFSVNGNPYSSNLFLIDGVNNNDTASGMTILVYPSVDTIAEFKMIRNSYGPEYGNAAGAIVSITTRSGENQFHGGFFYAGRNDALDANDWISNHNGTGKAEERRDDYGYNISGPVLKDKLFLWWNQEWNKDIEGASFATCVPTAAEEGGDFSGYSGTTDQCGATIPTIPAFAQAPSNSEVIANPDLAGSLIAQFYPTGPTTTTNGDNWTTQIRNHIDWSEWNVRGDYQVTRSERATMRWTQDSWTNPSPNNPQSPLWGESAFPTIGSSWGQPSKSVMAKLTSTASSTLVNDVQFGYGYAATITTLAGTKADLVPQIQAAYPSTFPSSIKQKDELFGWGGLQDYAGNLGNNNFLMWNVAPFGYHQDLYTIQDNLSKVKGNHLFKAGIFLDSGEVVNNVGDGEDRPTFPSYGCYNPTCHATNNSLADILMPGAASYGANAQMFSGITENSIDAVTDTHWHDIEPYVGDTWKIAHNITLEYGFRWSIFREPYGGTKGGNTDPTSQNSSNYPNQWANWNPALWSASEAAANPSDACNGIMVVPGTNPCASQKAFLQTLGVNLPLSNGTQGSNSALAQQNNHAIAPRVGIAWDVRGDGKTALRAGGGQFNQREPVGSNAPLARNAPFVLGIDTNRTFDTVTPLTTASISPSAAKTTNGKISNSWQWNLTVDQELHRNTTLELSYVGNTGQHLTSLYDANAIPTSSFLPATFASTSTTPTINSYRPAYNFGTISGEGRGGHASYHSLQALFRMQTGNFSTFQAAYTWGHSIGNVDLDVNDSTIEAEATTDQSNPGLDKGNTNINRPNIFVANEVLFLPKLASHGEFVKNTLGAWEANSIVSLDEGSSLTIYTAGATGGCTDYNADGSCAADGTSNLSALVGTGYTGNNRPLVTDTSCNTGRNGDQILNPDHFTLVGYTLGTFPSNMERRGSCFGAPNTNMDAQLAKNWNLKEKYRIKFSIDFFNLFNHPNFSSGNLESADYTASNVYCGGATPATPGGGPTGQPCSLTNNVITSAVGAPTSTTNSSGFGTATAIQGGARQLQYTLRFTF